MKHNDFASFYVIDYSSWFRYNYYNKINCNNSLHWLQVVVYNIGQTQAVKILSNGSTIFIEPPDPSMEFTHWTSNDWNPITETRFQGDTLESLCDWLALSDSIFYWPRPQSSKHQLENPPESGDSSRDSDHSKVSLFLWKFSKNTSFNMRIPLKTRFEIYENQLFVSDFFLDR